jgi:hypothetical protein
LKLFQEWGEGGLRRAMERVNSTMIYLIYCRNFCKCHNVLPASTTTKKDFYTLYNYHFLQL